MYLKSNTVNKEKALHAVHTTDCGQSLRMLWGFFFHRYLFLHRIRSLFIIQILCANIIIKLEVFLLSFMEKELEKKHGKLILYYMITMARLLNAKAWQSNKMPTVGRLCYKIN